MLSIFMQTAPKKYSTKHAVCSFYDHSTTNIAPVIIMLPKIDAHLFVYNSPPLNMEKEKLAVSGT